MQHQKQKTKFHAILSGSAIALLVLFLGSLIIHFSWNLFAPDLFGAQEMEFKNAMGIIIMLGTVAFIFKVNNRQHCTTPSQQSENQ